MGHMHRNERTAAILKILSDNPNKVYSLGVFSNMFKAARSTLSEDISIVKDVVSNIGCGVVETIPGAAGGVKYVPGMTADGKKDFINRLCIMLSNADRIIPGGFLYLSDIICQPDIACKIGTMLAQEFQDRNIDYVITIETKGIPIAATTARALNVPMVIVRRDGRVTEGPTVSVNYLSGSSKTIHTMSLAKRAVRRGSRCLFVDDFMRGGGTAHGIIKLLEEFESEVVGIGVLIETLAYTKKLVKDYLAIMKLISIDDENKQIVLQGSDYFLK